MTVVWSPLAVSDLDAILDFIDADKPDAATRVLERIHDHIEQLETMPYIGRVGMVPGTRELIFGSWPYIAVYQILEDRIRIVRVRHASQRWP